MTKTKVLQWIGPVLIGAVLVATLIHFNLLRPVVKSSTEQQKRDVASSTHEQGLLIQTLNAHMVELNAHRKALGDFNEQQGRDVASARHAQGLLNAHIEQQGRDAASARHEQGLLLHTLNSHMAEPKAHGKALHNYAENTASKDSIVEADRTAEQNAGGGRSESIVEHSKARSACSSGRELVFDVGHHTGGDTSYYLHKGYKVVAIEANPRLAEYTTQHNPRFQIPIANGDLTMCNVGITPEDNQSLPFYRNIFESAFSSFHPSIACRVPGVCDYCPSEQRTNLSACEKVTVTTRTCASLIHEHGVPVFIKIDIEGHDHVCFHSVASLPRNMLPLQISMESSNMKIVERMDELGYTGFKFVDQQKTRYTNPYEKSNEQSLKKDYQFSGGMPNEMVDAISKKQAWLSLAEALGAYQNETTLVMIQNHLDLVATRPY